MKHFHRLLIQTIVLFLLVFSHTIAQTEPLELQDSNPAFEAYRCDFIADTNQVRISATLVGADGLPIPISDVNLSVRVSEEDTALLPDDATIATVTQREPLQMIIVLDTTETVPVEEIVNELIEELFPRLLVEDEVALITFSQEIQPRTAFYTDKNRLVNEHVLDLLTLEGDNRLYAATLDAVTDFPLESNRRRVVLVLSDSGRRESDDTPVEEIVTRAQLNDVQIFPIGFYTRDFPRPIREDFFALANGTGGYAWFYDQPYISRTDVSEQVGAYLNEFVDALNGEISIAINVQGLEPNNNFINFTLQADTANDAIIETTVTCPIERLQHSIVFADDLNDIIVRGSVDIGVIPESDFDLNETVAIFRVDGEIVQDTGETIYTFNSLERTPGFYTITAELRDRRGNILATTPTSIRVFSQQTLGLNVLGADGNNLSGRLELILTVDEASENLSEAEFTIAPANDVSNVRVLGTSVFGDDNTATFIVEDVEADVNRLFPAFTSGTQYILGARVLGISNDDPLFAVTDDMLVTVSQPVADAVATPIAPTQEAISTPPIINDRVIWLGIVFALLLLNALLFSAVRRARIRKAINHPDDYELSPRLMTITVYSDGISQSHTLTKRTVFVGRGSSNDINLGPDSNISRNHGVIMWRKGHWYYSNRKSRLLARINDRRQRGLIYYRLKPFTEILIGNALMVFHENSQQDVADFVKTNI